MSTLSWKYSGFLILALMSTTVILLGVSLPGSNRLIFSVQDSGHFLIFTPLTMIALWTYRKRQIKTLGLIMLLLLLFGILIEGIQSFVDRDPSLYDVLMDLLGITAGGVLFGAFIRRTLPPRFSILTVLILALAAFSQPLYWFWVYQARSVQFPRLFDPDTLFSRALIKGNQGGELRHIDLPPEWSLDADPDIHSCVYVSLLKGAWPGVDMQEPVADWRGYESLQVSIYSDQSKDLPLVLRVHDQRHNRKFDDRYNRRLLIRPGYNRFSLPLSEIALAPKTRRMDLGAISDVTIFALPEYVGSGFCLLSMALK